MIMIELYNGSMCETCGEIPDIPHGDGEHIDIFPGACAEENRGTVPKTQHWI
jgi:hypothetical protein